MSEEGIPGSAEDVVAWPNFHPNFVAGASFRRSLLTIIVGFIFIFSQSNFMYLDIVISVSYFT